MISRNARKTILRVPLEELHVTEHQRRYPERVTHYVDLMTAHPDDDPGFILIEPHNGGYQIVDGHHRYVAHIITGRPTALCIRIDEPKDR